MFFNCYSELIQAIEKDHKGIRRKAALAAKAEGPFPASPSKQADNKPNPANIFEEMEEMLEARPTSTTGYTRDYDDGMIIGGDNANYSVRVKSTRPAHY